MDPVRVWEERVGVLLQCATVRCCCWRVRVVWVGLVWARLRFSLFVPMCARWFVPSPGSAAAAMGRDATASQRTENEQSVD